MTNPTQRQAPALVCPKCQGEMRQYERNGVTIDQCADCRGIFLDRGELEALIDANDAYNRRREGREPDTAAGDEDEERGYRESSHGSRGTSSGHGGEQGRKRRGGFLGGLFDD